MRPDDSGGSNVYEYTQRVDLQYPKELEEAGYTQPITVNISYQIYTEMVHSSPDIPDHGDNGRNNPGQTKPWDQAYCSVKNQSGPSVTLEPGKFYPLEIPVAHTLSGKFFKSISSFGPIVYNGKIYTYSGESIF